MCSIISVKLHKVEKGDSSYYNVNDIYSYYMYALKGWVRGYYMYHLYELYKTDQGCVIVSVYSLVSHILTAIN